MTISAETADLVRFTEEILKGQLHFLYIGGLVSYLGKPFINHYFKILTKYFVNYIKVFLHTKQFFFVRAVT